MNDAKRPAWYALLDAYTTLVHLMDEELQRDCGVPMAWYDVAVKIWFAPGHEIRMSDLADQVLLSRSWLTRRIIQLEQAGLVERRPSGEDGRGVIAAMTPEGKKAFKAWEKSHARSIARHFSEQLTDLDATVVRRCGIALAGHARTELGRGTPQLGYAPIT